MSDIPTHDSNGVLMDEAYFNNMRYKKERDGRPPKPHALRKIPRSVTLTDAEAAFLYTYGQGNTSRGIARAAAVCHKLQETARKQKAAAVAAAVRSPVPDEAPIWDEGEAE